MKRLWLKFVNWLNFNQFQEERIILLEKWVESEKREKEFYRDLLFKKFGINEEKREQVDYSEVYKNLQPRTWHHARRALELRAREKYWREKGEKTQ